MSTINPNQDTYQRAAIVSVLTFLENKFHIFHYAEDGSSRKVPIPVIMVNSRDYQFLNDIFKKDDALTIGDHEPVPRIVVDIDGIEIAGEYGTNRYARGNFEMTNDKGTSRLFSCNISYIPMTINFKLTLVCSSRLEYMKCVEVITAKLFRPNISYFNIDGLQGNVTISMSGTDFTQTINVTGDESTPGSMSSDGKLTSEISLKCGTYFPIFEHKFSYAEIREKAIKLLDYLDANMELNRPGYGYWDNASEEFSIGGIMIKQELNIFNL